MVSRTATSYGDARAAIVDVTKSGLPLPDRAAQPHVPLDRGRGPTQADAYRCGRQATDHRRLREHRRPSGADRIPHQRATQDRRCQPWCRAYRQLRRAHAWLARSRSMTKPAVAGPPVVSRSPAAGACCRRLTMAHISRVLPRQLCQSSSPALDSRRSRRTGCRSSAGFRSDVPQGP